MRGFGTAVIDDVDVLMKFLMFSSAGLYRLVSDSYGRFNVSGSCKHTRQEYETTHQYAFNQHVELALELLILLAEFFYTTC